jgi:predicted phosphodiesterase
MLIAVISDTHMPRGGRRLPDACVERIVVADLLLHAGDFSTLEVLRELEAIGPTLVGVHGNVDSADLVVFGHSHLPLHEQAPDGFQILNPGSPTERRRAPSHTMGLIRVLGGLATCDLVSL